MARGVSRKSKRGKAPDDVPDLTPAQIKELLRRVADSSDPRRYVIISRLLPGARFILYSNVSDDVYAWNDPALFKRRAAAKLIQRKLGRGNEVIACGTSGVRRPSCYRASRSARTACA